MRTVEVLAEALELVDGVRSTYRTTDHLRDALVLMDRLEKEGLVLIPRSTLRPEERPKPLFTSSVASDDNVEFTLVLNGRGRTPRQIAETREALGLMVPGLARKAGIAKQSIQKSETEGVGVSTTTLEAIEAAFVRLGVRVERSRSSPHAAIKPRSTRARFARSTPSTDRVGPMEPSMSAGTCFVVVPFNKDEEGNLMPGEANEAPNGDRAKRLAQGMAQRNAGAIAFSRTGDPDQGDFSDAQVIAVFGAVDVSSLGG